MGKLEFEDKAKTVTKNVKTEIRKESRVNTAKYVILKSL